MNQGKLLIHTVKEIAKPCTVRFIVPASLAIQYVYSYGRCKGAYCLHRQGQCSPADIKKTLE